MTRLSINSQNWNKMCHRLRDFEPVAKGGRRRHSRNLLVAMKDSKETEKERLIKLKLEG